MTQLIETLCIFSFVHSWLTKPGWPKKSFWHRRWNFPWKLSGFHRDWQKIVVLHWVNMVFCLSPVVWQYFNEALFCKYILFKFFVFFLWYSSQLDWKRGNESNWVETPKGVSECFISFLLVCEYHLWLIAILSLSAPHTNAKNLLATLNVNSHL